MNLTVKKIKKGVCISALTLSVLVASQVPTSVFASENQETVIGTQKKVESDASKSVVQVSNAKQYEDALKNVEVSTIEITANFSLNHSIEAIPSRDVEIIGNGHSVEMGYSFISGAVTGNAGTLTVKNWNITNLGVNETQVAAFFITPGENWSFNIENVDYSGERFIQAQNSSIQFLGKNKINTSAETAWVRSLVFANDSKYEGVSSTSPAAFSAFYFNGSYVDGSVAGSVKVGENANVSLNIAPEKKENIYPAFFDKIGKVDIDNGATLDIQSAGIALEFLPKTTYKEVPSINVASDATLNIVSRGGLNQPALKLFQEGAQVNAAKGAMINIEGNANSIIEMKQANSQININEADYSFVNKKANSPIFDGQGTLLSLEGVTLNTWGLTGGEYEEEPNESYDKLTLKSIITNGTSTNTVSSNNEAQKNFQTSNYGKISGMGNMQVTETPILNSLHDQDKLVTGVGNVGATINVYADGELLGTTTVASDGKWSLSIDPLVEGTVVEASQVIDGKESQKVSQTVSHLSNETMNSFKYGYWENFGLVLEGSIEKADLDLSNKDNVQKTIQFVDESNTIVKEVSAVNHDWYNPNVFSGYQVILDNATLDSLEAGKYKVVVSLTVGEISVTQDLNVSTARFVGHTIFDNIEEKSVGTHTIKPLNEAGVGYILVK